MFVIESFMWSRDFFRHEVGDTEGRGAITFTFVCKHFKLFQVEDFLWWVSANLEEHERRTARVVGGAELAGQRYERERTESSGHLAYLRRSK